MRKKYGNYITERRLGQGSFGEVWEAKHQATGQRVALKLEPRNTSVPQLFFEAKLYAMFQSSKSPNSESQPCNNIPAVYGTGQTENTNYIAMDLLGKSLEDIMLQTPKFSEKTVLMLAGQMISCVEYVHKFKYIHRDIKPDNFVMGCGENANKVYIIDFGLSKKYIDQNGKHIRNCSGKSLTGTARYASINALEGFEQSRRDDMESLFYVWIYCLRGRLPWMGLPNTGKRKYEAILNKKKATKVEELCSGFNPFFRTYLKEVKSLKFDQEPEYAKYRAMIYNAMVDGMILFDYHYDWTRVTRVPRSTPSPQTMIPDQRKKQELQKKLSTQVSPPSKEPSKNTAGNADASVEKQKEQKPYIPPQTIERLRPSPVMVQSPRTRQTTHKTVTMGSSAFRATTAASPRKSAAVGKDSASPKQPVSSVKRAKASPGTSAAAKRVETLRPSTKEKMSLLTSTIHPPVSYRAGTLPKWMKAPLSSRR